MFLLTKPFLKKPKNSHAVLITSFNFKKQTLTYRVFSVENVSTLNNILQKCEMCVKQGETLSQIVCI